MSFFYGQRTHMVVAGLIFVLATGSMFYWAAQQPDAAQEATPVAVSDAPTVTPIIDGQEGIAPIDEVSEQTSDQAQGQDTSTDQASETAEGVATTEEEISEVLEDISIAGWDDSELSNESLGL